MKPPHYALLLVFSLFATANLSASDGPALEPQLEPLRPLLDKTWKGAFKNSTPEKPMVDIMRWERALNGKAVRVLHSVNDGAYGGETIFMWDPKKQVVSYHYFTTAGFMTMGGLSVKDGILVTHETVAGSAGGVMQVRGTSEMLPNGSFRVTTEHLKDGNWEPGREVIYKEDATAKVIFK
jgi:hypothetical protein